MAWPANFKKGRWEDVVTGVGEKLQPYLDTPVGFDPRNIAAVPEPSAALLMLGGLGGGGVERAEDDLHWFHDSRVMV